MSGFGNAPPRASPPLVELALLLDAVQRTSADRDSLPSPPPDMQEALATHAVPASSPPNPLLALGAWGDPASFPDLLRPPSTYDLDGGPMS